MIKCFNCGSENSDGTKYCNYCGAIINVQPNEEPMEAIPVAEAVPVAEAIPAAEAVPVAEPQAPQAQPVTQSYQQPNQQNTRVNPAPNAQKSDGLCKAGLIVSIVSIFCCGITAIVGLGLSVAGFLRVRKTGQKGAGLAIAGMIISGIMVIVGIVSYASGSYRNITGTGKSTEPDETEITETSEEQTVETTKATTTTTTETTAESSESSAEETTESAAELTGIRPEFQQAMDDYEAFYDEYIDFMNRYNSTNDPLSMMTEYYELLNSMNEYQASFEEIGSEPMSAEEYALYMAVTARVEAKILAMGTGL